VDTVPVTIAMKDCLDRTTRFVFDASPAQAETYKPLGDVKILPVESSGFSVIIDIVDSHCCHSILRSVTNQQRLRKGG
jgi:hypothetical protein